ncbi:MAG TPA: WYL domain-containing protein [Gemmatimonadales bacterium]|nr:WYL domain-containing protein [Gemmatimonadales bacterium]
MADLAQNQIQRLVELVASMSQRDTEDTIPYREAARQLGVSEPTLKADLQVLLNLTESYKSWLGSLSVALTAEGFILGSRGSFRRPLRLNRDEALTLMLGLIGMPGGRELAARLGGDFATSQEHKEAERSWAIGPTPAERLAQLLGLARRARDEHRKLDILYSASAGEPSRRIVEPHQLVQAGKAWYLVAWCEKSKGTRRFRVERILEASLLDQSFSPRPEVTRVKSQKDLLAAPDAPTATVAFNNRIARWMEERYPGGKTAPDGRYIVEFPVADPNWLAREVLQYGAEAEVVSPEGMREFVRGIVR